MTELSRHQWSPGSRERGFQRLNGLTVSLVAITVAATGAVAYSTVHSSPPSTGSVVTSTAAHTSSTGTQVQAPGQTQSAPHATSGGS